MAGEGVEVRQLSLQADASKLVNGLVKGGNALNEFSSVVGKSDKQLRQTEKAIDKAGQQMITAAARAQRMKNEIRDLNKVLTASHRETTVLAAKLTTANKKLAEQQAIVRTQKSVIKALATQNGALATSYDKITGSATRANAAMARTKAGTLGTQFANSKPLGVNSLGGITPYGTVAIKDLNKQLTGTAAAANVATKNVRDSTGAFSLAQGGLNALRYQLYGVTAAYGILGAAVTTAGLAVFKHGIEWDKNFANVVRTSQVTGTAVEWLKDQFLELQTQIPVSAADLATIGTLGSQMGVAAVNISRFTQVTAQFAATAGVGVEESATALSRLDQLLPDVNGNYERLASTILLTGVNAVATEQQIVQGTSQIAAMGRIAGLTTPEIVALSSTLSSLGFRPELQRSVITSSFSRILTATSEVTAETEKFGAVLNLTGKEFQQAWNEDAIGTYEKLIKTIASRGDAVSVLKDLGLASQRLTPNLLKLGQNTEVLDEALADTAQGWRENSELSRQYGIIADTVAARIQVLGQTWDSLLVTLDSSDTVLKPLIDGLTGFLRALRQLAKNPVVSAVVTVGSAVTAAAGAMVLATAATAALTAGYIAIGEANAGLALAIAEHDAQLVVDTALTAGDAAANVALAEAVTAVGVAETGSSVAIGANTLALVENAAASGGAGLGMLRFSSGVISALPTVLKFTGIIGGAIAALTGLIALVATAPDWGHDLDKAFNGIDTARETVKFDTDKMQALGDAATKTAAAVAKIRANKGLNDGAEALAAGVTQQGGFVNGIGGALAAGLKGKELQAVKDDLAQQVEDLGSYEEQLAAVNQISQLLGVSSEDLLTNILPDLGSVLGDNAAQASDDADAMLKLESAQSLWAASLGTSDENLASLMDGIQSAAGSFLDFGSALTDAYDTSGDTGKGGGLGAFLDAITTKLADFESFYGNIGTLTQKGGVQLAAFFASQGAGATQALTDSLSLSPEQISQVEDQLSLAAFYAGDAFKQTFAQNEGLLAQVWQQSGHDPAAVAAFNTALNDSMQGGSIDPAVLASLAQQFGINIPVGFLPEFDEGEFETAAALLGATITPVQIPVITSVGGVPTALDEWIVTMEGHTIVLPVDPNTDEGAALIQEWRDNEYNTPVSLRTTAETSGAQAILTAFYNSWNNKSVSFKIATSYAYNSGSVGSIPSGPHSRGGLAGARNGSYGLPGYARGGFPSIVKGRGSSTSDSNLIRVGRGEAITRGLAVRHYGAKMFNDINNLRFPRFASGGMYGSSPGGSGVGGGTTINATVVQNYPTTRDPIKKMKQDAESVLAGIWI